MAKINLSDKAQDALSKVIEKFAAGDVSDIVQVARLRANKAIPASKWSFSNQFFAYAQTASLDCRGFKQWKAAGRSVKKGATAAFILGPVTKVVEDEDGNEKTVVVGFRSIPVFPFHMTEGDVLADEFAPAALPELWDVAQALGVEVGYADAAAAPGALGNYRPGHGFITLTTHDEAVFWHELAHAAHDKLDGMNGTYAEGELVAELTACAVAAMFGQDNSGRSLRYVQRYAETTDPEELMQQLRKVLPTVGDVLDLILSLAE